MKYYNKLKWYLQNTFWLNIFQKNECSNEKQYPLKSTYHFNVQLLSALCPKELRFNDSSWIKLDYFCSILNKQDLQQT